MFRHQLPQDSFNALAFQFEELCIIRKYYQRLIYSESSLYMYAFCSDLTVEESIRVLGDASCRHG